MSIACGIFFPPVNQPPADPLRNRIRAKRGYWQRFANETAQKYEIKR